MITKNKESIVTWKNFEFPVCIKTFSLSETAKVATYEYAGRNGAEHERVLNYRIFNITGILAAGTDGIHTPSYFAKKLRSLNDNAPGTLKHPAFGSFTCILNSLKLSEDGSENEVYRYGVNGGGDEVMVPNYSFEMEFWEHLDPAEATLASNLTALFPAANPKPANDNYKTSLKYTTVSELYQALVKGAILPGLDPIRNAEWLQYDYAFRLEAYNLWLANPTGEGTTTTTTDKDQKTYTVSSGDTGLKIANKFKVKFTDLFQKNVGRDVRNTNKGKEGKKWKTAGTLYSGDVLLIP